VTPVAKDMKSMTLRIPADQAAELEKVAEIDRVPVSEAVRDAIAKHIEARRQDAAFRERLQRLVKENQEILDRLAR
jgi:Arc/MetJ-type ribon-helix-helix transcriptional regulator